MFRNIIGLGTLSISALIPLKMDQKTDEFIPKYGGIEYEEFVAQKSGLERLRLMFTADEFDTISKELSSVFQSCFFGTFIGACYGGFVKSRVSYFDFIENNQATSFYSNLDAKKKLQHQVTMSFARGALHWGWRMCFFVGAYSFLSTTISVYRGKSSMLEYITAGTITGSLYKLNHGLPGVLVGGGLGFVLGCLGGGVSLATLSLSGASIDEVRYWQYQWKHMRDKQLNDIIEKTATEKHDPLITVHDHSLKESGKAIIVGIKGEEFSEAEIKN